MVMMTSNSASYSCSLGWKTPHTDQLYWYISMIFKSCKMFTIGPFNTNSEPDILKTRFYRSHVPLIPTHGKSFWKPDSMSLKWKCSNHLCPSSENLVGRHIVCSKYSITTDLGKIPDMLRWCKEARILLYRFDESYPSAVETIPKISFIWHHMGVVDLNPQTTRLLAHFTMEFDGWRVYYSVTQSAG
jgi:hypothetical protein